MAENNDSSRWLQKLCLKNLQICELLTQFDWATIPPMHGSVKNGLYLKGNYYWRYSHISLNHDYGRKSRSFIFDMFLGSSKAKLCSFIVNNPLLHHPYSGRFVWFSPGLCGFCSPQMFFRRWSMKRKEHALMPPKLIGRKSKGIYPPT